MKINLHHPLITIATCMVALCSCNKDDIIDIGPDYDIDDPAFRPATARSSAYQTQVFEYTPAPGQFINETVTGGFDGTQTTPQAAADYALRRLSDGKFVSLGAFGGYIVVGFDHSIAATNLAYDFAIRGNALAESNEPGIVKVMQDTNRNGLPDDTWYELRASETEAEGTISRYSVTYYRPQGQGMPVRWTDSQGHQGEVAYLKDYHSQPSYYPAWISADSYTLTGTCIAPRTTVDNATGKWANHPYAWGYADNIGSDALPGTQQWTGFKISNAMLPDGTKANLRFIDFIMVQQAVQSTAGWLGENSCEVLGFADYSLMDK